MVAQLIAELERPLSRKRLESYRGDDDSDLAMVVNYFHNLELSEALYPALQALEIALRNSVHQALTQHFNSEYWFDTPNLFPTPPPGIDPVTQNSLPPAIPWQAESIRKAREKLNSERKTSDADRIVAELHLGFWNSLFNRPFVEPIWLARQGMTLRQVFPHARRSEQVPRKLERRITRIRLLRNRVMHYEPIWNRRSLKANHEDILETLAWISPAMHETIAMCDRFPALHGEGKSNMQERIVQEILRRYPGSPQPVVQKG